MTEIHNENEDMVTTNYEMIVDKLMEKNALSVTVHDLSEISGFTETFIVVIARSDLHAKTLKHAASEILDELNLPHNVEGESSSKWCLMDAGHIIINILSKEGNEFYRLDSLWGDAPTKKFEEEE